MTRDEFLMRLERALWSLPPHERVEIMGDYIEHFQMGLENGKTEAELCASLGEPEELAKSFLDGREPASPPTGQPYAAGQPAPSRPTYGPGTQAWTPTNPSGSNQAVATVLVILFNVFIAVPVIGTIGGIFAALPAMAVGFLVAAGALIAFAVSVAGTALMIASIVCIAVALLSLSILLIIAMIAIIRQVIRFFKWYVPLCSRICREGRWPVNEGVAA